MFSLYPELLSWYFYVPVAFRLFLAWYFFSTGWRTARLGDDSHAHDRVAIGVLGGIETLLGVFFLLGLFTQAVASAAFALSIVGAIFARRRSVLVPEPPVFFVLLGLVSLSLVFLGAGPLAFDLPL